MKIKNTEIVILKGDITSIDTEAIVNTADSSFSMAGGVSKAVKIKGGKAIQEEARRKGRPQPGDVVLTSAGSLPSKYIIHAISVKDDLTTNERIIRQATSAALLCAQSNNISSIAFCALGCGVAKLEPETVSKIMTQEIFKYLREQDVALQKIVFVLNSSDLLNIFEKNVISYLKHLTEKMNQGPFITVDGIVIYEQDIVMVKRSNPPLGWALPGGFLDYGESLEDAVVREIKEETNLEFINFKQLKSYSAIDRDPRFHTVSVVFMGQGRGNIRPDSDAKDAQIFELDALPNNISFDHRDIIEDYKKIINYK